MGLIMKQIIIDKVIEQFGDEEYFKECAQDIVNHGADGEFNGFIYYSDTVPFGEMMRVHLKPVLQELAEEFGEDGIFSLLKYFKCCKDLSQDEIADGWYSAESDSHTQVMNCLAWFALEEVARVVSESEEVEA